MSQHHPEWEGADIEELPVALSQLPSQAQDKGTFVESLPHRVGV